MLAPLKAAYGNIGVARMRRRDDDRFNLGSVHEGAEVRKNLAAVARDQRLAGRRRSRLNAPQLKVGRRLDRREITRAGDVPAADDSDPDFRHGSPPLFSTLDPSADDTRSSRLDARDRRRR